MLNSSWVSSGRKSSSTFGSKKLIERKPLQTAEAGMKSALHSSTTAESMEKSFSDDFIYWWSYQSRLSIALPHLSWLTRNQVVSQSKQDSKNFLWKCFRFEDLIITFTWFICETYYYLSTLFVGKCLHCFERKHLDFIAIRTWRLNQAWSHRCCRAFVFFTFVSQL